MQLDNARGSINCPAQMLCYTVEMVLYLVIDNSYATLYNNYYGLKKSVTNYIKMLTSGEEKYSRGRRGAPAKGVGRETGARVRIPLSPLRRSIKWTPKVNFRDDREINFFFLNCDFL